MNAGGAASAKVTATPAPSAKPAKGGKAAAAPAPAGEAKEKKASGDAKAAPAKAPVAAGGAGGTASAAPAPAEPKSFARRDKLRAIEAGVQASWEAEKTFEDNAPEGGADDGRGKFFVTFPYPYMNGKLHLGHAFTITKADFSANFHRLLGEHVLFPFAFHCTGMPIQAAANKLKRELEADSDDDAAAPETKTEAPAPAAAADGAPGADVALGTFRGKKTKLVAKGGGATQYNILLMSGVPEDEIPKFVVSCGALIAVGR